MMIYKGYIGHIDYDNEQEIFHGEVINTRDVITFEGSTVKALKKSFIDSIEDYLAFCAQRGEEPERPFSGKFNLRLDPELHREISISAKRSRKSLNEWVIEAIREHLHTG